MENILYNVLSVIVLLNTPLFLLCSAVCFASGWTAAANPGKKSTMMLRGVSSGLCLMLFVFGVLRRQVLYALVPILIFYWMLPAGIAAAQFSAGRKREIRPYHKAALALLVLFICYEAYALIWNLVK